MDTQTCPACGTQNRSAAKFCQKCGAALQNTMPSARAAVPQAPNPRRQTALEKVKLLGRDILQQIDDGLDSLFGSAQKVPGTRKSPASPVEQPVPSHSAPTVALAHLSSTKKPGEQLLSYTILRVWPLGHGNYYKVRLGRCPQGHDNLPGGNEHCTVCQAELPCFLVHETIPLTVPAGNGSRQALIELSRAGTPGLHKHIQIFDLEGRQYAVSEYPREPWQSLAQVSRAVDDPKRIIHWCADIGQALARLSESHYHPAPASPADILEPLIIIQEEIAGFADLTVFSAASSTVQPTGQSGLGAGLQHRQIAFLGQVLYTLASGNQQAMQRAPADLADVPPPFRKLVFQVRRNEFQNLAQFLEALRSAAGRPEETRSLRQIPSHRTDTGRARDHNEDFVGKYALGMQQTPDDPEIGLYLVADGMGGHQAGEVASKDVVRVILEQIQEKANALQASPKIKRSTVDLQKVATPGEVLKQAILQANTVIHTARRTSGSDRGTTLTAALIVGDSCAVANVGDSRTYLLRAGQLEQITRDHSLVASLVAANVLKPEEVRSHPQRSQIYRTLGDKANLEVDIFERQLANGDRLLLCSDGLWEMVLDQDIEKILRQAANPAVACDRLIETANLAGGEDNISVIVIWIE